jgi:hypothetical protein
MTPPDPTQYYCLCIRGPALPKTPRKRRPHRPPAKHPVRNELNAAARTAQMQRHVSLSPYR